MGRIVLVLGAAIGLGGCMPVGVSVASAVMDALSYAGSGKSVSDNALSAVLDKDCAMYRVVTDGDVCQAIGPNGEGRTVVTNEPATEPQSREDAEQSDGGSSLLPLAGQAVKAGASLALSSKGQPDTASALRAGAPVAAMGVRALSAQTAARGNGSSATTTTAASRSGSQPAARVAAAPVAEPAAQAPKVLVSLPPQPAVLVGTYTTAENARLAAADRRLADFRVERTEIRGKTFYHLLVAPPPVLRPSAPAAIVALRPDNSAN
ncbi:MAG: hypothetical protein OHK0024_21960 [Thalassobaculales bacterium]